ncbi:MAG: AMP-dependent synthetase/ligase [Polyangiales bacterium]
MELSTRSCARFADRPVFGTKRGGQWVWTSYRELGELIDRCRAGLHQLGVGRGDVVAIVTNNCVEWAVACYATYGLEAAFVPLYEAQMPAEWLFILQDSGAKVVLARAGKPYAQVVEARAELPKVEHVIGIDLPANDPSSFAALLEAGAKAPVPAADPAESTIAGLVYTSGTTGKPKGVVLSHGNLASNVSTAAEVFPLTPDDRLLSFLPWAHSYGQLELHYGLLQGVSLALNDDIKQLLANLAEVKPTMFVTVPRVFHRVYEAVRSDIAKRPRFVQRLFADGIRCATRKSRGERVGVLERIELDVDDKLIFQKIRDRFGGRLKYVMCASAALGKEVAEFVDALGIQVYEGYGLTETSPMVSGNSPTARKLGSVGRPIPGVRIVIDTSAGDQEGRGEIVVYGPNVMQGYHNRPEENEAAFTSDGGLRTGDLGCLDRDGFLFITGRIKEQYKLENGKYVMPGPLEEELKISRYIANVMLHGANKPYNVALVVLDNAAIATWASELGIEVTDPAHDPRVEKLILGELRRLSSSFRAYEAPRRVLLVTDDFSTDNGFLTPTLKLKRRNVELRYGPALEALYIEPQPRPVRFATEAGARSP